MTRESEAVRLAKRPWEIEQARLADAFERETRQDQCRRNAELIVASAQIPGHGADGKLIRLAEQVRENWR